MAQDDQVQVPDTNVSHNWYFRKSRADHSQVFEFPTALNKQDASNRIAAQFGVKELSEIHKEATISQRELAKLEDEPVEISEPTPKDTKKG